MDPQRWKRKTKVDHEIAMEEGKHLLRSKFSIKFLQNQVDETSNMQKYHLTLTIFSSRSSLHSPAITHGLRRLGLQSIEQKAYSETSMKKARIYNNSNRPEDLNGLLG